MGDLTERDYQAYDERQTLQFRKFMHWVKSAGGHEGPTQIDTLISPKQLGRMTWLKEMARGRVLEVGCNWGWILAWCHGHAGVDINPMNVDLAQIFAPHREFYVADAVSLPFPDKSFDTVMAPETLEHLDFPGGVRQAIQEVERVARDRVLITIPDGRTDTPDALNFKHAWLFDDAAAQKMLSWMPGANLAYFYGFGLIYWPVGGR